MTTKMLIEKYINFIHEQTHYIRELKDKLHRKTEQVSHRNMQIKDLKTALLEAQKTRQRDYIEHSEEVKDLKAQIVALTKPEKNSGTCDYE